VQAPFDPPKTNADMRKNRGAFVNRKRPKQIVIRLSEQEFEDLKIKVEQSGKNQQQYIIEALTKKRVVNTDGLKEVAGELKRQGNNLNQIAKRLNQMEPVSYGQFQEDIKEFTQIWQLLKQSLQELG
jgi:CRISPR/Cas system CSM-associated protein Csm2 small subunit